MNCFHAKFTEMSYSLNFKSDVNVILLTNIKNTFSQWTLPLSGIFGVNFSVFD